MLHHANVHWGSSTKRSPPESVAKYRDAVANAMEVLSEADRSDLRDLHHRQAKPGSDLTDPRRPRLRPRVRQSKRIWIYRYKCPRGVLDLDYLVRHVLTKAQARVPHRLMNANQ